MAAIHPFSRPSSESIQQLNAKKESGEISFKCIRETIQENIKKNLIRQEKNVSNIPDKRIKKKTKNKIITDREKKFAVDVRKRQQLDNRLIQLRAEKWAKEVWEIQKDDYEILDRALYSKSREEKNEYDYVKKRYSLFSGKKTHNRDG